MRMSEDILDVRKLQHEYATKTNRARDLGKRHRLVAHVGPNLVRRWVDGEEGGRRRVETGVKRALVGDRSDRAQVVQHRAAVAKGYGVVDIACAVRLPLPSRLAKRSHD